VFSPINSAVTSAAERRAAAPLLLGARRMPLSINISPQHGARQQTRRTPLLQSNDGTYRPCQKQSKFHFFKYYMTSYN